MVSDCDSDDDDNDDGRDKDDDGDSGDDYNAYDCGDGDDDVDGDDNDDDNGQGGRDDDDDGAELHCGEVNDDDNADHHDSWIMMDTTFTKPTADDRRMPAVGLVKVLGTQDLHYFLPLAVRNREGPSGHKGINRTRHG